jgi:hypothetical protein
MKTSMMLPLLAAVLTACGGGSGGVASDPTLLNWAVRDYQPKPAPGFITQIVNVQFASDSAVGVLDHQLSEGVFRLDFRTVPSLVSSYLRLGATEILQVNLHREEFYVEVQIEFMDGFNLLRHEWYAETAQLRVESTRVNVGFRYFVWDVEQGEWEGQVLLRHK